MSDSYYKPEELLSLGLTKVGKNPQVSRRVAFHRLSGQMGDNVRIDDYCVITGHIEFGSHIHIAPFCMLMGTGSTITMEDCSGLSSHCSIYTASDDYRADTLSNPTVPVTARKLVKGPVTLGIGVLVGSHCVILPKVTIGAGASIGSQSIVYKNITEGSICTSGAKTMDITDKRDVKVIKAAAAKLK